MIYSEMNQPCQTRRGSIEVICGSMFSGKTEELIRRIKVLEFAKKNVLVFKPALDNRYSDTKVVSHGGSQVDSIVVDDAMAILDFVKDDTDVVAIDEVPQAGWFGRLWDALRLWIKNL